MTTSSKYKNTFEEMKEYSVPKNCNLCTHQSVCLAFSLFKQTIEPSILDQNSTLKAQNLARICDIYEEKGLR